MAKITEDLIRREKEVRGYVEAHADLFDLDPNLIRGLITQESRFTAEAVSPTGAYGFGQFTGIACRQVQNIAAMTEKASDLADFTKPEASDPDRGIKAICATLWWLFNKKYVNVTDRKVQLEAVLTFYNSGGRPAALVIKHGGHAEAVDAIKELPIRYQSQAVKYAPELAIWFIAWHEYFEAQKDAAPPKQIPRGGDNPFDETEGRLNSKHMLFAKILLLLAAEDKDIDSMVDSRDGLTEITLIFPGEFN